MSTWSGPITLDVIGETHDYVPYAIDVNATTIDSAVAALSPWAYWKMDEASGTPQDSSGNARHMSGISDATYSQAAISSKGGNSIRFGQFGGRARAAVPSQLGSTSGTYWTVTFLSRVTQFQASGSPNAISPIFESGNGSNQSDVKLAVMSSSPYALMNGGQNIGGGSSNGFTILNVGHVISIVGGLVGTEYWSFDLWIDAVRWSSIGRGGFQGGTQNFAFGRSETVTVGFAEVAFSNIAVWDSTLTDAQIRALHETYMDSTMLAAAYVP